MARWSNLEISAMLIYIDPFANEVSDFFKSGYEKTFFDLNWEYAHKRVCDLFHRTKFWQEWLENNEKAQQEGEGVEVPELTEDAATDWIRDQGIIEEWLDAAPIAKRRELARLLFQVNVS